MMTMFLVVLHLFLVVRLAVGGNISLPNCSDQCGTVQIPYPFGVGDNCYYNKSYEIICNTSFSRPKPFLGEYNLEVLEINWPGRYSRLDLMYVEYQSNPLSNRRLTVALQPLNLCENDGATPAMVGSYDFRGSPFWFSRQFNVFRVEGCVGSVILRNRTGGILAGCASVCAGDDPVYYSSSCYGVGCCQASLVSSATTDGEEDLNYYAISLDLGHLPKSNTCYSSAILMESESVDKITGNWSSIQTLPSVIEWDGVHSLYNDDSLRTTFYDSETKVSCYRTTAGLNCDCVFAYEGNPFLPNGCQVVEKCRKCVDHCEIFDYPDGSGSFYACQKNERARRASIIGFSSGIGLVVLVVGCYWLYRYLKRRKEIKRKAIYFKRNGGLLLQQQMSSEEGVVERTKVFTVTELEKTTDSYNENRILGQGGQGTVYKGMVMDGRIAAIKKSKKVDETQVEPFINEVVLLSQINHRNVVGLLGCCLETEVPILVYEFIPNGTLYEHIQGQVEDFHLTWKMRLQIAAESAGAVAYLHSSSSAPIYHRDIKSTNILLDEKYRAKVSDFGTSRAISIDQTHVTTAVIGTYGYLDPEYFQSNQFTEKSDVYSFGVVLVELLSGKKPICPTANGGWISLAVEFLSKMEDSRLSEILDSRILNEGKEDEFMAIAILAKKCLNMNGKLRPTMKEIAMQLEGMRSSQMHILKEVKPSEIDHVVPEAIHLHRNASSTSMFSLNDDPPDCSIEVQPLMSTGKYLTAQRTF